VRHSFLAYFPEFVPVFANRLKKLDCFHSGRCSALAAAMARLVRISSYFPAASKLTG